MKEFKGYDKEFLMGVASQFNSFEECKNFIYGSECNIYNDGSLIKFHFLV